MALFPQFFDKIQALVDALAIWIGAENRRTKVHVQADDAQMRIADHALSHLKNRLNVQPKFGAFDAGIGLDVRFGRQIGVDAQGHGSGSTHAFGDVG